jgi:hypothetical protein
MLAQYISTSFALDSGLLPDGQMDAIDEFEVVIMIAVVIERWGRPQ